VRAIFTIDGGHDGLFEAEGAEGIVRCVRLWRDAGRFTSPASVSS
jgi:hypothetical protein